MLEALTFIRSCIEAYLGRQEDGSYELNEIDLKKLDPADFSAKIQLVKVILGDTTEDPSHLNWIDMQHKILTNMVDAAIDNFRYAVETHHPKSTLLLTNQELIAAAEAERAFADN